MTEPEVLITLDPAEESPAPRRPMWRQAVAVVLVFAAGIALGYRLPRPVPRTEQPPPGNVSTQLVLPTYSRCSAQVGDALWLGVEFLNQSPNPVTVFPEISTPIGGLIPTSTTWGTCGQFHADPWVLATGRTVEAGATLWVSALFDLVEPGTCPAPYPLFFTLSYADATGRAGSTEDGFPDLGNVPYSACIPSS